MALGFVVTGGSSGGTSKINVSETLAAKTWSADTTYTLDLSAHGLNGKEDYLIAVSMSATDDQKDEFAQSCIEGKSQSTTGIVLSAKTKPKNDIPIEIVILKG